MLKLEINYLYHIRDEIKYLTKKSKGTTYSRFIKDETLQRVFIRSLEIIGEAVKKLPKEFKSDYQDVEWKAIAGTRDKLIHD